MGASSMIILTLAALAFSIFATLIAKVVTKTTSNKAKLEPYECGIPTTGQTWIQLSVGYYLFALIFLIHINPRWNIGVICVPIKQKK